MEFLSTVNSLGIVPLLILILVIFILLFKDIRKDNERMARELQDHEAKISASIKEYKATTEKQIAAQNAALEKMESRIRAVEMDYAEKTYVQEVNSSWRTEMRRIEDKIDKMLMGREKCYSISRFLGETSLLLYMK